MKPLRRFHTKPTPAQALASYRRAQRGANLGFLLTGVLAGAVIFAVVILLT